MSGNARDIIDLSRHQGTQQAMAEFRQALGVTPIPAEEKQVAALTPTDIVLPDGYDWIDPAAEQERLETLRREVKETLTKTRNERQRELDALPKGPDTDNDMEQIALAAEISALDQDIAAAETASPLQIASMSAKAHMTEANSDAKAKEALGRAEVAHGTLTAEKFGEVYEAHRAELDQFWKEWHKEEAALSQEISSLSRTLNDKYDLGIDVEGYERQRNDLLQQIENEKDPLKKAKLRHELAEVTYKIADENVQSLEERMANNEYVDPKDYQRALKAREEAGKSRDEAAKGIKEEEKSILMKAEAEAQREREQLELRMANLEASLANGNLNAEQRQLLQAERGTLEEQINKNAADIVQMREETEQVLTTVKKVDGKQEELTTNFYSTGEIEDRTQEGKSDKEMADVQTTSNDLQTINNMVASPLAKNQTFSQAAVFASAEIPGLNGMAEKPVQPAASTFASVEIPGLNEVADTAEPSQPATAKYKSVEVAGLDEVEDNPPAPTPKGEPDKSQKQGKAPPTMGA